LKKSLILHIGTEKTGTSSIQSFLTARAEWLLEEHRVLYPTHPRLFHWVGHFPVAASFLDPSRVDFVPHSAITDPRGIVRRIEREIDENDARLCILSCEHFSSRLKQDQLVELRKMLAGFDVRVLVYLRRQDEMAMAAFSTALRRGRRTWFNPDDIHPDDGYWNFDKMLGWWADAFGEESITARIFDRHQLIGGDVVLDCLAMVGITLNDPPSIPRANKSLSLKEAELVYALNRRLVSRDEAVAAGRPERYRAAQQLRELALEVAKHVNSISGSGPLGAILSDRQKQALNEKFFESNRRVARRFFGRDELFDDPPARSGREGGTSPGIGIGDLLRLGLRASRRLGQIRQLLGAMRR